MKNIIIVIITLSLGSQLFGCNSETTSPANEKLFTIEGIINSNVSLSGDELQMDAIYDLYRSSIYLYVFDSSTIGVDNKFRLNISSPPSYLMGKMNLSNTTSSDTSAKFYVQDHFNVYKNENYLGGVSCTEKPSDSLGNTSSNYWVTFIYSTKNVSITGYDSIYSPLAITKYKYNLFLNSGWNQVVHNISHPDSLSSIINVSVDNIFKGNWFYQKY